MVKNMIREPIRFDYTNMMSTALKDGHGIQPEWPEAYAACAKAAFGTVESKYKKSPVEFWQAWRDLLYNQKEIVEEVHQVAQYVCEHFETFVVFGIGGSALGPIAVHQAINHLHYNELPKEKRGGPRFYVEDNVDPERMTALLDVIDVRTSCFNVITKSGTTAETMSQFMIIAEKLQEACGEEWTKHIIITTDREKGNLVSLGKHYGDFLHRFVIPDGVGGRFSELCPVGLLPAAVCNIDIQALLDGAAAMDARCQCGDYRENPALHAALLSYLAMTKLGVNITVMMPYTDSLKYIADWFCQLWAESLGKRLNFTGTQFVYSGQTPVKSLGVTDQHSQCQLYCEGPFDKMITLIKVENYRSSVSVPVAGKVFSGTRDLDPDVVFLGDRQVGLEKLIQAELEGTKIALTNAARMNQTVVLPEVNEYTLGQLLYFFELMTAYAGELLSIDAFDQPGVEAGKIASYVNLGIAEYYRSIDEERTAKLADNPKALRKWEDRKAKMFDMEAKMHLQ